MDDQKIIQLYWQRNESAIAESDSQYGSYCRTIAYNILHDRLDTEECVNDTWLKAWHAMPPQRPNKLGAFFGRITRNLSLDRWRRSNAEKRGGSTTQVALEELRDCIPARDNVAEAADEMVLTECLERFLRGLPPRTRCIFLRRYWYLSPIGEIAKEYGMTTGRVTSLLHRTRSSLRQYLEQEGITV